MENTNKYNGWKNYCTWAAALWIDNDQGSYNYFREEVQQIRRETEDKDEQRYNLAECVKEYIEENAPEIQASMYSDLLSFALSEIDYNEIAENMLED